MPSALRSLFVSILLNCNPVNSAELWEDFKKQLSEDIRHEYYFLQTHNDNDSNNDDEYYIYNKALIDIEMKLSHHRSLNKHYGLPEPDYYYSSLNDEEKEKEKEELENKELNFELNYNKEKLRQLIDTNVSLFNHEQLSTYQSILASIYDDDDEDEDEDEEDIVETKKNNCHFIDAPGGTGKTFLSNTILATVREKGDIAIAVSTTAISSLLLHGGRTAHSKFQLPLECKPGMVCNISANSPKAEILRLAKVIIWDESPMANRYLFEALDKTCQDIRKCDKQFGGITIVLCGDFFRQIILPVIIRGGRPQIVNSCIKKSYLWNYFKVHKLTISQRIANFTSNNNNYDDALEFYNYLMRIGNGTEQTFNQYGEEDMVRLPNHMVSEARNLEEFFVDKVYPSLDINCSDTNFIMSRAILTPLNEDVDVINTIALQKISGEEEEILKSIDKMEDDDNSCLYPVEFLNSLESNGLPAHNLKLKKRAVIMLLRNLDTASGACNGTRLIVNNISTRVIDATIINCSHANHRFFIPRIPLSPETNILKI
jgi:ATP-dependent DNA helicase PIF1